MAVPDIGKLLDADEHLNHQIADTFATIAVSDIGWTEKIWASLARKDGGLQIDFGLGQYHNRNVMDAFGGVSRNAEQWTVRASRALSPDLETTAVGPIRYEVVVPLKKVRYILEKNETQPIAFDVLFEGELPPFFEKRNKLRAGHRIGLDLVRYHQPGKLSGWIEINGEREEIGEDWFGFRDHSWGMRGHGIGAHPTDLEPSAGVTRNMELFWGPWLMRRPDGSKYEIMHFHYTTDNWSYFSGHVNEACSDDPAGKQQEIRRMTPSFRFDTKTRALLAGSVDILMDSGENRHVEIEPIGGTGFYLRTGEYGGWKGGRHGSWRGKYHQDGEYIPDIVQELPKIGQLRDRPVLLREGDAVGYGIQESMIHGLYPELGLDASSDFSSDL